MDENARTTVATNVAMLMDGAKISQKELERRSGVSQATISKLLNPSSDPRYAPTITVIEKIADAFGIKPWQLMIPSLPPELLSSHVVEKIVENFSAIDDEGRDTVSRIAQAELRYTQYRANPSLQKGTKK